jgi:hypothetical protein
VFWHSSDGGQTWSHRPLPEQGYESPGPAELLLQMPRTAGGPFQALPAIFGRRLTLEGTGTLSSVPETTIVNPRGAEGVLLTRLPFRCGRLPT